MNRRMQRDFFERLAGNSKKELETWHSKLKIQVNFKVCDLCVDFAGTSFRQKYELHQGDKVMADGFNWAMWVCLRTKQQHKLIHDKTLNIYLKDLCSDGNSSSQLDSTSSRLSHSSSYDKAESIKTSPGQTFQVQNWSQKRALRIASRANERICAC